MILRYFLPLAQRGTIAALCELARKPIFHAHARHNPPLSAATPHPASRRSHRSAFAERFGTSPVDPATARPRRARAHRRAPLAPQVHRRSAVDPALLRLLFACALSAPSKSDLQQADIVHVADRAKVRAITALIPDMPWIAEAPVLLVFCGNNRRIRQIGEWRGKPFANDHLDHFMNAAVDAGIVMTTFIRAAEAVGLGACPISAHPQPPARSERAARAARLGLSGGGTHASAIPAKDGRITPRLPLEVTVHVDRYDESRVRENIDAYDRRRHALHAVSQAARHEASAGEAEFYGWSEDKARQYGVPERADFGAFIREKRFKLD